MSSSFDFSKTKIPAKVQQDQSSKKAALPELEYDDKRGESVSQLKLQEKANQSNNVGQFSELENLANDSQQVTQLMDLQETINEPQAQQDPIQMKENNTGLPDNLKSGVENLSGHSMDDVNVHHNSDKPAQLQAAAYAQGTDIHLGPGQEKHLPHEAWHVVQQKQGRVKPTMQMKGEINVNDDYGLEKEADLMGQKALQLKGKEDVSNDSGLEKKADSTRAKTLQKKEKGDRNGKVLDSGIWNTPEEEESAKKNWGIMSEKVLGNKKRTKKDVDKSGVAKEMMEEGKQKIDEGNSTNNQGLINEGRTILDEANKIREYSEDKTRIKRLVGGNWVEDGAFGEERDEKQRRMVEKSDKIDENGEPVLNDKGEIEKEKVKSKYQLTSEEKAGLGKEYDSGPKWIGKKYESTETGDDFKEIYERYARKQLDKFQKTHAFISEWAFGNILGQWKSWGTDSNFVAPLSDAESLLIKAKDGNGIETLEKELGIPAGSWASPTNSIYRFIVHNPKQFDLRLPKGMESGAYQKEWVLGGKTLGGGAEAVINSMTLEDLRNNIANGVIEIKRLTFIGDKKAEQIPISL